jgi:hypothetical protein
METAVMMSCWSLNLCQPPTSPPIISQHPLGWNSEEFRQGGSVYMGVNEPGSRDSTPPQV